jgi:hypothetical protein
MNWTELRPVLREKFGKDFTFYNDVYRSGTRRIKICCLNPSDMCFFIKCLDPKLDVKLFESITNWGGGKRLRVTIHYR